MAKITLTEEVGTPTVPAAGTISIYAKTDDLMYYLDSAGNEQLITAGTAVTALTGDVTAVGPGSAVATIAANAVTNSKSAQMPAYTVKGNPTSSLANASDAQTLILGVPGYVAPSSIAHLTAADPDFLQVALQNGNTGTGSSADYVASNDIGTDSAYYVNFGINSSIYAGSGPLNTPNNSYMVSNGGDMVLASETSHSVLLLAAGSTTEALKIDALNNLCTTGLTGYIKGAAGNPATASATVPVADLSGVLPIASGGTNASSALSNNRVMQSSSGAIVEAAAITAARALISDANGIPTHSAVTGTELGYVSGVTSAIQTQLDSKASAFPIVTVSGDVTLTSNAIHLVSSAAARVLTLPAHLSGQQIYIKDSTGSCETNNFTLAAAGGGNIDGLSANKTLRTNWGSWLLVDNGTDWFIL